VHPTDEDFAAQLRATFYAEAIEHVEALSRGLLELEGLPASARRSELLDGMFREAHSLKGASAAASQPRITAVCQSMETVLASWRGGASEPIATEIDSVSDALDTVVALLEPSTGPARTVKAGSEIVRAPDHPASHPDPGHAATSTPVSPPPDPSSAPSSTAATGTQDTMVRVAAGKIDALMLQAEEMLAIKLAQNRHASGARDLDTRTRAWRKGWDAARADLASVDRLTPAALRRVRAVLDGTSAFAAELSARTSALAAGAEQDRRHVGPLVDDMLAQVESVLMLPFSSISALFGKMVRDLARQEGKEVDLVVSGAETELDRRILERLKDPLVHAIRNAVSHGIETPEGRATAGKPERGVVRVVVSRLEDSRVSIEVTDDGRGLDPAGIRDAAVATGAATREQVELLDDDRSLSLAFEPGVSTNPIVTDISGRGVGLNVVRRNIEELEGAVSFRSAAGGGSTLRLVVPTALATIRGVVVEVGGRPYVVPTTLLYRVMRVSRDSIKTAANQPTILVDERPVPMVDLAALVGIPRPRDRKPDDRIQAFVLGGRDERITFGVDRVMREQDVLVKSLGPQLARVASVSGATVLETGQVAPVFDTRGLIAAANALWQAGGALGQEEEPAEVAPSILIAEDSVTSRMLLRNILTTAGFRVRTTCDGSEALTVLKTELFDAVVSDVQMPKIDGFELTVRIRADARTARIPVILVTGRESQSDKARGIEAGANAYLIKSNFDKNNLLETLRRLT